MEGKTWQEKWRNCISRMFRIRVSPAEDQAQEGKSSDAPVVVTTDTAAGASEVEARSEETGTPPSQVEKSAKTSAEDAAASGQVESAGARTEETAKPSSGSDGADKQQTAEVNPLQRKWTNSISKIFKKSVPPAAEQAQEEKKGDVPADVAAGADAGTPEKEVRPEETGKQSKVESAEPCAEQAAASGQVENAGVRTGETPKPVLEARSGPADSSVEKQPAAEVVQPAAHEESEASAAAAEQPRGRTFSLFKRSSH